MFDTQLSGLLRSLVPVLLLIILFTLDPLWALFQLILVFWQIIDILILLNNVVLDFFTLAHLFV